jgi:hypothetical protein
MINPHKISMAIKRRLKWLVTTHYGRFALAIMLCLSGIFSQHSTIDFLSTNYAIFDYLVAAGVLIIIVEFIWMMVYVVYNFINRNK